MVALPNDELINWINRNLEIRNLSGAEACRRAGLNLGAISEIANGRQPGLKVCIGLSELFGTPIEKVLRMAGHLPPEPGQGAPDDLRLKALLLIEKVRDLPGPSAAAIMDAAILQAEALKIALGESEVEEEPAIGEGRRPQQ